MKKLFSTLVVLIGLSVNLLAVDINSSVDGYNLRLYSNKSLVVGNNRLFIELKKDKKVVDNAKVKVKFFMPEMVGMPYMEYKAKASFNKDRGVFATDIQLSMGGTWQYILKFKTADGAVHKIRGSVNL